MEAGKLWHEIAIQSRGDTRDTFGGSIPAWSAYASTYAELKNLSGNELIQAQQIDSRITSKFTVRWDNGIRSSMRIVYKSRNYNIVYVNNIDERDKTTELLCERLESVTNG
jgi:SPP1 family predicted phage head-tail adaptor